MTVTLETVTKKKPEPTAEQVAAEELVRRAREQGLSLTGPDGLLKQLTKVVIETALDQEPRTWAMRGTPPLATRPAMSATGAGPRRC
jgi:hypothetical protein